MIFGGKFDFLSFQSNISQRGGLFTGLEVILQSRRKFKKKYNKIILLQKTHNFDIKNVFSQVISKQMCVCSFVTFFFRCPIPVISVFLVELGK